MRGWRGGGDHFLRNICEQRVSIVSSCLGNYTISVLVIGGGKAAVSRGLNNYHRVHCKQLWWRLSTTQTVFCVKTLHSLADLNMAQSSLRSPVFPVFIAKICTEFAQLTLVNKFTRAWEQSYQTLCYSFSSADRSRKCHCKLHTQGKTPRICLSV